MLDAAMVVSECCGMIVRSSAYERTFMLRLT